MGVRLGGVFSLSPTAALSISPILSSRVSFSSARSTALLSSPPPLGRFPSRAPIWSGCRRTGGGGIRRRMTRRRLGCGRRRLGRSRRRLSRGHCLCCGRRFRANVDGCRHLHRGNYDRGFSSGRLDPVVAGGGSGHGCGSGERMSSHVISLGCIASISGGRPLVLFNIFILSKLPKYSMVLRQPRCRCRRRRRRRCPTTTSRSRRRTGDTRPACH
jgi:hypothetical protein